MYLAICEASERFKTWAPLSFQLMRVANGPKLGAGSSVQSIEFLNEGVIWGCGTVCKTKSERFKKK